MKKLILKKHSTTASLAGFGIRDYCFIIAVTGCLYAFQEEIQNITQDYRFVEKQKVPFLLPFAITTNCSKRIA